MPRPAGMLRQVARLTPVGRSIPRDRQVSAALVWNSNGWLELSYGLLALAPPGLSTLVLPSPLEDGPQHAHRQDGLWTANCFEAFLAVPAQSRYWALSLAPNGGGTVYSLQGSRSSQQPQPRKQDHERGSHGMPNQTGGDGRRAVPSRW